MNEALNPRHARSAGIPGRRNEDPLAELARIVGNEDPFANLFDDARRQDDPADTAPRAEPHLRAQASQSRHAAYDGGAYDPPAEPRLGEDARGYEASDEDGQQDYYEDEQLPADAAADYDPDFDAPRGQGFVPLSHGGSAAQARARLAANTETRHQAGYADDDFADDFSGEDDGFETDQPKRRRSGTLWMAASALVLAVVAGGGAMAWKNGVFDPGIAVPGKAPVILASREPAKILADKTAGPEASAPSKEIFERANVRVVKPETVVPREEQPVAISAIPKPNPPEIPAAQPLPTTRSVELDIPTATASSVVEEIDATPVSVAPSAIGSGRAPLGSTAVEPRKVRTVKVMADGTVVTGEVPAPSRTIVASAAAEVPDGVPSLSLPPGAQEQDSQGQDSQDQDSQDQDSRSAAGAPDTGEAVDGQDAAPDAGEEQADAAANPNDAAAADADAQAPAVVAIPPARPKNVPTDAPAQLAEAETPDAPEPAAAAPAAPKPVAAKPVAAKLVATKPVQVASLDPAPAAAAAVPASSGAWVVQISSQKSQSDALASFQSMQRRFPAVMGGLKPSIKKAELADRGTFFRVRVGPWSSRDEATALCVKLKAAGGDCVVARN